jgi:hypothetical protein
MALNDENGGGIPATMLVGPATFGGAQTMPYYPMPMWGGGNGGNGMFGGDGSWIILLIIVLLAAGGGWGNNFGGNNGGFGGAPIVINDGGNSGYAVQRGFDQAAVMSGVSALQSGISALSTQLCGCCGDMQNTMNQGFNGVQQSLCTGFAGVNATVNGAQNAIAQQLYANQIADMERSFAAQTANTQGLTAVQSSLAQCCCENRLATNDLKYTIATENCADRAALSDGVRDILANQTAGIQRILDQLCQDKIDAKNDEISALRQQIAMKDLAASQTAQNAFIQQGFANEVDQLYNRLNTCPVPTTPVYGRTPIFTCNNGGCGCGNSVGGFNGTF